METAIVEKAIVIVTCLKRPEIKMAAPAVKATGKEILFVEEEDGSCTVFGTDEIGNAVDIRDDATLKVTSADAAYVVAELPPGLPKDAKDIKNMTFRLRGVAPTLPDKPVIVGIDLAPAKDSTFKAVHVDLPCMVTRQAPVPRSIGPAVLVVTLGEPVVGGDKAVKPAANSSPVITSPAIANGIVGQPFTYQVVGTHSPTIYSANGLPVGLVINGNSGVINGTPLVAGTSQVTLTAKNAAGNESSAVLAITIRPA